MTPKQAQDFLETLRTFQYEAEPDDFRRIFGATLSAHLWSKFSNVYNHNPLSLYESLDPRNAKTFATALTSWYPGQTKIMKKEVFH